MHVEQLYIYPLKSARAVRVAESTVTASGLSGDRSAMLVDENGRFITQREMPQLARLSAQHKAGRLVLSAEDGFLVDAFPDDGGRRLDVSVWDCRVNAALADKNSCDAISDWLGHRVSLVFFDNQAQRLASAAWAGPGTPVSFADGYQILVTTTGSLAALNADLVQNGEAPVGMDRFRPNLVIDHDEPWIEDTWSAIEAAGIRFDLVKPCARCVITTQDQATGSRDAANPMPAMGRMRMSADPRVPGPLFGWNVTPRGEGTLRLGDRVRIIEARPDGWMFKKRKSA